VSQVRLKFDMKDWLHHTDLDIVYPEYGKKLPSQLEELVRKIEKIIASLLVQSNLHSPICSTSFTSAGLNKTAGDKIF